MKKQVLIIATFFIAISSYAQVDVKVDKLALVFGKLGIAAEYLVNDNVGAELTYVTKVGDKISLKSFHRVRASGRFYVLPDAKANGIFAGLYMSATSRAKDRLSSIGNPMQTFEMGGQVGAKLMLDNFFAEGSLGLGKSMLMGGNHAAFEKDWFSDYDGGLDAHLTLSLGYRF